ncbi:alpha/beta-Hydrolases superfamily protein [Trifolium repens]|nr:alpha/beta-Hydrolases superfamily protein [Trifolium repens]
MLPAPIFSIFIRCSKYPIYSEHIKSDGFTNKHGIQADKAANESLDKLFLSEFIAMSSPAVTKLLKKRIPCFTFSLLIICSIGADGNGELKRKDSINMPLLAIVLPACKAMHDPREWPANHMLEPLPPTLATIFLTVSIAIFEREVR